MSSTLSKREFLKELEASKSEQPSWLYSDFDAPTWIIPNDNGGTRRTHSHNTLQIDFAQLLPDHSDLTDPINRDFLTDLKRSLTFAFSPYSPSRLNQFSLLYRLALELKHLAVFFAYQDIRNERGTLSLGAAEPWHYREFCERAAEGGAFGVRYISEQAHRLLISLSGREPLPSEAITLKEILHDLGLPPHYAPTELIEIIRSFGVQLSSSSRRLEATEHTDSDHLHINKRSISRYSSLINAWTYLYNARHHMKDPLLFNPAEENKGPGPDPITVTVPKRRTRSIPKELSFALLNLASRWCFVYQPHITSYIQRLERTLSSLREGRTAKREYYMNKAFELVDQPSVLHELGIARYVAHKRGTPTETQFTSLSVENLRHLSTGAFFLLTATLTARRRSELVSLSVSDINRHNGGAELCFVQRKSGQLGPNKTLSRPIPKIFASAMEEYIRMDEDSRNKHFPDGESPLFVNVFGKNLSGLANLAVERLQFFYEYLAFQHPGLPNWRLKPHQLRRLFAQLYFWHRPDSNVDALTWFLGHLSTDETLTYLTDSTDQVDLTHEESHFITSAISEPIDGDESVVVPESLLNYLRSKRVEVSDYDSVNYHVRKLQKKGLITSRRLRFSGNDKNPLIAIEFNSNG